MQLTKEEQITLLELARNSIKAALSGAKLPPAPPAKGNLAEHAGAFVTLHKRGMLRGCIGNMIGQGELVHTIQEMAIASALHDSRFKQVTIDELGEIVIEISVLSPMKRIKDVNEIEVGKHGIMIIQGYRRGVLLPQVAPEQGWDRETFLMHTCYKAGLAPSAWKDANTIIEIFSAEIFGEARS